MATLKINKKALYQKTLDLAIADENYEGAAKIRDCLATIPDDEVIEIDDEEVLGKTDTDDDLV